MAEAPLHNTSTARQPISYEVTITTKKKYYVTAYDAEEAIGQLPQYSFPAFFVSETTEVNKA